MTDLMQYGMPQADQADRTAQQVRIDYPRSPVHRVLQSTFTRLRGHVYETACGGVLSAERGAILTTYPVDCCGCIPRWKAGPS